MRMGMVGGGQGAFIGAVHRIAAAIDQQIELVCGAFSTKPDTCKATGEELHLPAERSYTSFTEMMEKEATLPLGERMDFVVIVTPNHVHFPAAKAALEAGFHVLSDKPATLNHAEAVELKKIVDETGLIYGLSYTYTGYPMVKQAKHMIANGDLGKIRKVIVEYPQGYLATKVEDTGMKQAEWRTDPKRSGVAGCIGDIGSHCENLAEYITGLEITELAADLTSFVDGRTLDDDGNILLRFQNGAKGILHASQISVGEENNLNIRVYGEKGGLEWHQYEPNTLIVKHIDQPAQLYRTGNSYICEAAANVTRTPASHPEGYLEAFANVYLAFSQHVQDRLNGTEQASYDYSDIDAGIRGMAFIEASVKSSQDNAAWTKL